MLILQEYKVPTTKDIPADFRVELLRDAPNPSGVLGAKGKYRQKIGMDPLKNLQQIIQPWKRCCCSDPVLCSYINCVVIDATHTFTPYCSKSSTRHFHRL